MGCHGTPGKPRMIYFERDQGYKPPPARCPGCEDCIPLTGEELGILARDRVLSWRFHYDGDPVDSGRIRALCDSNEALRATLDVERGISKQAMDECAALRSSLASTTAERDEARDLATQFGAQASEAMAEWNRWETKANELSNLLSLADAAGKLSRAGR